MMTRYQMISFLSKCNIDTMYNLSNWTDQRLKNSVKFIQESVKKAKEA